MVVVCLHRFYSYLNLESTKTKSILEIRNCMFYSYLNLESTKTNENGDMLEKAFYSYLNLESTKTQSLTLVLME